MNKYNDVEGEENKDNADGEEIFGCDGDLVEEIEEPENNNNHKRIINEDDPEDVEEVAEVPEPEDDQAERMINKLIEAFEEDVLPEGEQLLEEVNEDKSESADRRYRTRNQEEPDRLMHAQKVQQKVGHSNILGANQVPTRGTQKLGMTCNQKLMTRHRSQDQIR